MSESLAENASDAGPAPVGPPEPDGEHPLSFAQERLLFLDRYEPGCVAFNVPQVLRLRGRWTEGPGAALGEILRRHEALRTSFPTEESTPRAEIAEGSDVTLPLVEIRGTSGDEREGRQARSRSRNRDSRSTSPGGLSSEPSCSGWATRSTGSS